MDLTDTPIQLDDAEAAAIAQKLCTDVQVARSNAATHLDAVQWFREHYYAYELSEEDDPPLFEGAQRPRVPYVRTATQVLCAALYPQLFGPAIVLHLDPDNETDARHAKLLEQYYALLLRKMNYAARVGRQGIYEAFASGTAVTTVYWKREQRYQWGYFPAKEPVTERQSVEVTDPATGETRTVEEDVTYYPLELRREPVVIYDLPWIDLIDAERVVPLPVQCGSVQDSAGLAVHWYATEEALWQGVEDGRFDKAAVETLLDTWDVDASETTSADAKHGITPMQPQEVRDGKVRRKTNARLTADSVRWVTTFYYRYSPKGTRDAAINDWVFTIHEPTQTVLQARVSDTNLRPYATARPYADEFGIYGHSLPMAGGADAEDSMTLMHRIGINMMERQVNPRKGVSMALFEWLNKTFGQKAEKKFNASGALIPLPQQFYAQEGQAIIPLDNMGASANSTLNQQEIAERYGNMSVAVDDASKGLATPTQVTATQAAEIAAQSRQRMAMAGERLGDGLVVETGKLLHSLVQQYYSDATLQRLWVELHGQETADAYPLLDCLSKSYTFMANGLRQAQSDALKAERAAALLQLAQADDYIWTSPERRHRFMELAVRDIGGQKDPSYLIGTANERVQAMMEQQQALAEAQAQVASPAESKTDPMLESALRSAGSAIGKLVGQSAAASTVQAMGPQLPQAGQQVGADMLADMLEQEGVADQVMQEGANG